MPHRSAIAGTRIGTSTNHNNSIHSCLEEDHSVLAQKLLDAASIIALQRIASREGGRPRRLNNSPIVWHVHRTHLPTSSPNKRMKSYFPARSVIGLLLLVLGFCAGFVPTSMHRDPSFLRKGRSHPSSSLSTLWIGGDLFENFKNFWEEWNKGGQQQQQQPEGSSQDEDQAAAGTTLITTIPVQRIKRGGLRLFLMFYLMGMQNTPDKRTWQAIQPSSDEYAVEMYFKDATAMLTIELMEDKITILRCGSTPSTSYLMQESVIIQGILDELDKCANEENVELNDRLLVPEPANAIDKARGAVSFG